MTKEKKYGEAEKLSAFNTAVTKTDWYYDNILYYRIYLLPIRNMHYALADKITFFHTSSE